MGANGLSYAGFDYLAILLLILLAGLAVILLSDIYIRRDHKKIILIVIFLIASLLGQNYAEYQLIVGTPRIMLRTLTSVYGYCVRPILIVLFYYIISDEKNTLLAWILTCVNAAVYITAFFSPVAFSISESNTFIRGPLGFTCHIVTAILLVYLLVLTIRDLVLPGKAGAGIPVFNTATIILTAILDSSVFGREDYPLSVTTVAVVICSLLYYLWLHLLFVREHEQDMEAQQRIRIMITQIQPHFLYNTLSTIRVLCRKNPEMAAEITEKFGMYLRQNLDSLGMSGLIPFRKELEHTRIYTDIEMVRFDNIQVEYDIRESDFSVPPLSLQPIVENAIRHGVRIREKGKILVETEKSEGYYMIRVTDNGTGFDLAAIEESDDTHIGIRNVRERVEKMCFGTLTIESRKDEGTRVEIRIPEDTGS